MSEKKKLNQEELEKVSGGSPFNFNKVKTKNYIDIMINFLKENNMPGNELVTFEVLEGRTENDNLNDAKNWCLQHNYTYQSYEVVTTYTLRVD